MFRGSARGKPGAPRGAAGARGLGGAPRARGRGGAPRGGSALSSYGSGYAAAAVIDYAATDYTADYAGGGYASYGGGYDATGYESGYQAGYGAAGDLGYASFATPTARGGRGGRIAAAAAAGQPSTHTRSTDPNSVNSRIFVGNLNTSLVSRDDLERIFARFGAIEGISVHKGYAFVQYTAEQDARSAVAFTDQSVIGGKPVDVNMVSEPKREKAAGNINGATRGAAAGGAVRGVKRPRFDSSGATAGAAYGSYGGGGSALKTVPISNYASADFEPTDGYPDTLICGSCHAVFNDWTTFKEHRKQPCIPAQTPFNLHKPDGEPEVLHCYLCGAEFSYGWPLIQHCGEVHSMAICS